jgi:hypothetical protein
MARHHRHHYCLQVIRHCRKIAHDSEARVVEAMAMMLLTLMVLVEQYAVLREAIRIRFVAADWPIVLSVMVVGPACLCVVLRTTLEIEELHCWQSLMAKRVTQEWVAIEVRADRQWTE